MIPRRRRSAFTGALAAIALAGAGCGADFGDPDPIVLERADTPASLPGDWDRHTARRGGFTVGVPDGFEADWGPRGATIEADDGTAAVRIAADRTDEALEAALDGLAESILERLEGFSSIDADDAVASAGEGYERVVLPATARTDAGDRRRVDVAVLRRPGVAVFTVISVRSEPIEDGALPDRDLERLLDSVRSRPPEVPPGMPRGEPTPGAPAGAP